jgi:clan AA aspartic protease (TIGR02281 family)
MWRSSKDLFRDFLALFGLVSGIALLTAGAALSQAPGKPSQDSGATWMMLPPLATAADAVLYEEDPTDTDGKQFPGTVAWQSPTVSPAPGLPPDIIVRADIEVPDRQIKVAWSLRRNSDQALRVSHLIDIKFEVPADFPHGGIQSVPGLWAKQPALLRAVPRNLSSRVTAGYWLIGVSHVEAALLNSQGRLDIPILYNDGRRAILSVNKGTLGARAFAEAFKEWGAEEAVPIGPGWPELSLPSPTSSVLTRQTLVPLQIEGGTFKVPASINDSITLNFVIDSGAADVTISEDVVLMLMRRGALNDADFLGAKSYRLADGRTVPGRTFRIRLLKVGDKVLENVTGSVLSGKGSLLLGQSFLSRLKSWSIDNKRQVLVLE